jgi:hypothetical protein
MLANDPNYAGSMRKRRLALEQYRLECAESWPDSPFKRATVAAIRSTLAALAVESARGV